VTSKHDSMDIVYQCLSKGAADFLVKPMRKNELKNLWQHVWRKNCNRSANTRGVGRSTVNETRKLVAPSSPVDSKNMSGIHNVNDCENAADGLNILGGSDNGRGIQPLQVQRNHGTGPSLAGDGDEDCLAISEDKSSAGISFILLVIMSTFKVF
jgi:pseudo-response regulator 7